MNKKINYNNSSVWLAAQKELVAMKDAKGKILASPLYKYAPEAKDRADSTFVTPEEGLSWLKRRVDSVSLAI